MKLKAQFLIVCFIAIALTAPNLWAEQAPEKVTRLANTDLAAFGSDSVITAAVKAENAKSKSMAQIKAMDDKWQNTPGIADFMKTMMTSECGRYLRGIQKKMPYISEIFVMDNQGANVAMTDKTSDYWQGDEAKFKKSFGTASVFIDEVEFDDSAQAYLCQVSVPVSDGGTVIGAITFGIDIDRLE